MVWVLWACSLFGSLQLLLVWGLLDTVAFWLNRIIWAIFVIALFWLLWEALRRYLVVAIDRDRMWQRLALLFWHEYLLSELIHLSKRAPSQPRTPFFSESVIDAISYPLVASAAELDDRPTLDEFGMFQLCVCWWHSCVRAELWRGAALREQAFFMDAPAVLLSQDIEEERSVERIRLSLKLTHYVFRMMDADRDGVIRTKEFEAIVGVDVARGEVLTHLFPRTPN